MLESKYFWSPEISRGGSSFFLLVKKGSPRNTSMRGEILCRCWVCWAGSSCCAPAEEGEIQDRCLQPQVWPWSGGSLCTSQTDGFVSNQLPPVTAEHVPGTPYKWGCQSLCSRHSPPPSACSEPPAEPRVSPMGRDFPPLHAAVFFGFTGRWCLPADEFLSVPLLWGNLCQPFALCKGKHASA